MKRNALKKTIAFVLAMTLVTGGMPVNVPSFLTGGTEIVARAGSAYEDGSLLVGGASVAGTTTSEAGWSFDATSKTLTLNGVNIKTSDLPESGSHCGIEYMGYDISDTLTIVLVGTNTIDLSNSQEPDAYGINTHFASLVISGEGSLTVKGKGAGIVGNDLTISGGTVSAEGNGDENSLGIYALGNVAFTGGTVTAVGKTSSDAQSIGVYGKNITVGAAATVTATGGTCGFNTHSDGKTINDIAGTGWDNVDGTGDGTAIAVSAEGQNLSSFNKVQFLAPVTYLDADGTTQTCSEYNVVNSTNGVKAGWNVVSGTVKLGPQSLSGDVNIILCDNAQLTVNGGASSALSINNGGSLTIYAQSTGNSMGKLVASSNSGWALNAAKDITINGGNVSATTSGNSKQGIRADNGSVTINGGIVEANGTNSGIYASSNVEINGGTVTAQATGWCAIGSTVKNKIAGVGWTDASGSGDGTTIAVSETGQDLYSYKRVQFETPAHTHSFTSYTATADTITATCSADDCPLDDGSGNHTATLTIAPSSTGGNTAELTGNVSDFGVTNANIQYQTKTSTGWQNMASAPESGAIGFFKASITVGGQTATVTYGVSTVAKGAATNPSGKSYDFTVPTAAAVGSKIKPTLTTALDTGYEIKKITVKDGSGADVSAAVQADAEGFIMPDYNVTVDVEFGMIDYTITKSTATNGTFTVKNGEDEVTTAHYGDTVTLTAEPDDGYVLSALTVKDSANFMMELSGSGNTRTFTMPDKNVTVSANFREKSHAGAAVTTTGDGGTASLMKNDYSELKSTDQVTEGDKFILCVNKEDEYDFKVSGTNMTEFTEDEYKAYIAYAEKNNISVSADTVLAWVTMPYVAGDTLNLNVNFQKQQTYTILYQPKEGENPDLVACKIVRSVNNADETSYTALQRGATMGDGTAVWSMKMTAAFPPTKIAFIGTSKPATDQQKTDFTNTLKNATTNTATVSESASADWTEITDNGKYLLIGGDAKVVTAAFIADASTMTTYKDNAVDASETTDSTIYRLAVVTESGGTITPGTVKAPAAPAAPTGKEFAGWRGFQYDTNGKASEKIYAANEENISVRDNATFTAVWKPATLNVKLNLGGGTGGSNVTSATYGQTLTISQNPTREGYSFEGWTVGKTVTESGVSFVKGSPFDLNTPITADLELTAQWKHEHSYSCYQISDFGDSLAKYQKYASAVHIAVCGCEDVELVAHEFDSNGKCACGYQIPTSDNATLEISYGQLTGGSYTAKMLGVPETAKKNQEVSIYAPAMWGNNLEFSKWQYSTDGTNWYDLTADAYASFLIPCNMQVRALYVNPVTVPQVELFARPYDDQAVVDGKTYTMDNMLFQMNYKLPDGYTLEDAGIRMGDNGGISYYFIQQVRYSYDNESKGILAGMATGLTALNFFASGDIDLGLMYDVGTGMFEKGYSVNYLETEANVLEKEKMDAATLAQYMYESKPINVPKYDPIYWEAKAKTKGMSGSMATLPPLRFAQKNNQNHYIYGIGWMRYKKPDGTIETIYTDALPATVKNIPSNPVTKSGS